MSDIFPPAPNDDEPFDLEREPLDRPPSLARDWGGDGTDLSRPVRAHLLAALRPNSAPYAPPVAALITLGEPRKPGVAEHREALGLQQKHLPELLRMTRDRDLYTANGDTDKVWAPLHAFYALSNLDVSAIVPDLIQLFDLVETTCHPRSAEDRAQRSMLVWQRPEVQALPFGCRPAQQALSRRR